MNWRDSEEIALALESKYSAINPLELRLSALLDMIMSLDGFIGDRGESSESKLEAVLAEWFEIRGIE